MLTSEEGANVKTVILSGVCSRIRTQSVGVEC